MRTFRGFKPVAGIGIAAALIFGGTACGSAEEPTATSANRTADSASAAPFDAATLRSQLPESLRESGELRVGTNVPFAPMVYRDGERLVGFDIDLVQAIAELLELKVDAQERPFPSLIGGVENGRLDSAARGIFDTAAREEKVDMVTYLRVGTQWAVKAGSDIDPTDACGRKVGALAGTTQETTELPAKSKACTSLGEDEIDIVDFPSESAAFAALTSGRVDAVSADSPVVLYEAKRSGDKIVAAGHAFDTQPYALPVQKDSSLGPVLRDTIQHLIDTGQLDRIAHRWGLSRGVVHKSTINAAIS